MKLIIELTAYEAPSEFAYSCVDDNYEPGCIQGFGSTEIEAVEDYLEQLKDRLEDEADERISTKLMDPQTGVLNE